jgi:hypothetical protein
MSDTLQTSTPGMGSLEVLQHAPRLRATYAAWVVATHLVPEVSERPRQRQIPIHASVDDEAACLQNTLSLRSYLRLVVPRERKRHACATQNRSRIANVSNRERALRDEQCNESGTTCPCRPATVAQVGVHLPDHVSELLRYLPCFFSLCRSLALVRVSAQSLRKLFCCPARAKLTAMAIEYGKATQIWPEQFSHDLVFHGQTPASEP